MRRKSVLDSESLLKITEDTTDGLYPIPESRDPSKSSESSESIAETKNSENVAPKKETVPVTPASPSGA